MSIFDYSLCDLCVNYSSDICADCEILAKLRAFCSMMADQED